MPDGLQGRARKRRSQRERDRHLLYYRGNLRSKRMNFHHQTDSLYRYPTFNADTLITDVFLSTYYFNSSYKKLENIKNRKEKAG